MTLQTSELEGKALRLAELDESIVRTIEQREIDLMFEALESFEQVRRSIQIDLLRSPIHILRHPTARRVIRRLSEGPPFQADRVQRTLVSNTHEPVELVELDDDKVDDLALNAFYSWTSGNDYVRAVYGLGVIAVAVPLPQHLHRSLEEARNCYALRQYQAVAAVCRSLLEAAVFDVGRRRGVFSPRRNPNWKELIKSLPMGDLKQSIARLYRRLSSLVHPGGWLRPSDARGIYEQSLALLNELYDPETGSV